MQRLLSTLLGLLATQSLQAAFEKPGKDATNTAINIGSCYTADCSNCQYQSWVLSSGNYALAKVDIWISGASFKGIQLHYKDAANNVLTGNLIGESSGVTATSYTITKQVVGVTMKQLGPHTSNTKQPQSGFILHFADATTQSIGAVVATDTAFYSPLTVGLLGLRCNFHESPHGGNVFNKSYGCIPYDNFCTDYSLDDRTISNMAILVSQSATQDISFSLCVYQACGTRVYTITPTLSFLALPGTTLTLSTNNPADAGTYSMNLTVKLQDYPTVATITKTFQVTVTCTVLSLSFTAITPASQTIRIGVDTQPFSIPFAYTKTPLCLQTPVLTLNPNNLAFLSVNQSGNGGYMIINGATVTNKGMYAISLGASVDSVAAQVSTSLTIQDLCETSTLVTSPVALSPMTINMPSAPSQTQVFSITTDVQMQYPTVVCNRAAFLTPSPAFISLSADYQTITVDTLVINLPSDIGVHTFSLTIKSVNYPLTVTPITLNFDVNIVCTVSGFQVTSKPADSTYVLNQGPLQTLPFDVKQQDDCKFPQSYSQAYIKDGVAIVQPPWITFNSITRAFNLAVTSPADVGVYSITNIVSIPQLNPVTGQNRSLSATFILNVISDCTLSSITELALRDMTMVINGQPDQQSVAFADYIGTLHNDPTYCQARSYQLLPSLPFLSISNSILTAASTSVADQGIYDVRLVVGLAAYPQVSLLTTNSFKITVVCNILSIQQTVKMPDRLTQRILVDPMISQPFAFVSFPACNMDIALTPSQPYSFKADLTATSKVEIFASLLQQRGVYDFVLSAKPRFPNIGVDSTMKFQVVLVNLCQQAKFVDQEIQGIEMMKQNPAYLTTQLIPLKPFSYSPLTDLQVNCGQIQTKLLVLPSKEDPPSWIKMGSNNIQVSLFMVDKAIALQLELAISLVDYPQIEMRKSFNVTLSESEITCLANPSVTYHLGEPPLGFGLIFQNKTEGTVNLTPIKEPLYLDKQGNEISKPSFLSYLTGSGTFIVDSQSEESLGNYQVGLTLGYLEYPATQVTCLKKLQVIYEPLFTPQKQEIKDQTLIAGKKWIYALPAYSDAFGRKASVDLDLGNAIDIFQYDALTGSLTLKVDPKELVVYLGSYQLKVTLIDKQGAKKTIEFSITILDLAGVAQQEKVPVKLPPPKPYFEKVTQFGLVRIAFTRPIVLPTFDRYPEFSIDQNLNRNCTNGGICQPKRRLELLSQEEEVKEAIEIANRGLVWVNNTAHPLMKLFMLPGEDSDQSKLNFTWNCTEFQNDYMDLEVSYQFREEISSHDDMDRIRVEFLGRQYFSADDGQFFLPEEAKIQRFVPSQMNPAQGKKLSLIAGMIGQTSKWLVVANFVKNALIGGSLSQMFSATNKLQLMVHLLITNVKTPAIMQIYFSQLLQLVTFSLIDLEPLLRRWLHLQDQMEFKKNFFALGYHSVFFIVNLNNILLAIIYHIIALCVILLTTPIANQRIQGWRSKLKAKICWNSILSLLNESLIIITLSCFMQFEFLTFKSKGEIFSSVAALIFGLIVVQLPFLNLWLMIKNKNKLKCKEFKREFETVYENLNYDRSLFLGMLMEPFLSQIRVLLMAFYLIYFEHYPYFQIFFTNLLVTFMVIHIEWFEVYREKSYRRQQVFNEVFMCLINYHLICFADFIRDQPTITFVGWSAIVTITFNLVVNFSIVIYDSVKDAYQKLRIWYYRRKWTYLNHLLTKRRAKTLQQSQTVLNSHHIVDSVDQQDRKLPQNEEQHRQNDQSSSSLFVPSPKVHITNPELQDQNMKNYIQAKFQQSKQALIEDERKPHTTIDQKPLGIEEDDCVPVKSKPLMIRDRFTGRLILQKPELSNPSKLTTARQSRLVSEDSSSINGVLDDNKLLRVADIHPQTNLRGKILDISSLCEESKVEQLASPDRHMQEEIEYSLEQWARVQKRARLATQAFPDVRTTELMFKKLWEPDE